MPEDVHLRCWLWQRSDQLAGLPTNMGHVDDAAGERNLLGALVLLIKWSAPIHVARYCRNRCKGCKLLHYLGFANVARMQNVLNARKVRGNRRVEAAMRVPNNAN